MAAYVIITAMKRSDKTMDLSLIRRMLVITNRQREQERERKRACNRAYQARKRNAERAARQRQADGVPSP